MFCEIKILSLVEEVSFLYDMWQHILKIFRLRTVLFSLAIYHEEEAV